MRIEMTELQGPTYGRWWSYANGQWIDPFTGFRADSKSEFANYIADKYGHKEAEYFLRNYREFMSIDWHLQFPAYMKHLQNRAKSSEVPREGT